MWRDVLIVLALIFSILTYFHLTPRRLSTFFNTVKSTAGKKRPTQIIILALAIISSLLIAFDIVIHLEELQWSTIFFIISAHTVVWHIALISYWEFPSRKIKALRIVLVSIFLVAFISGISFTDMPIWRKIVTPLVGFSGGFTLRWIESIIRNKINARRMAIGQTR